MERKRDSLHKNGIADDRFRASQSSQGRMHDSGGVPGASECQVQNPMQDKIVKFGRLGIVALITIVSVVGSVLMTFVANRYLGFKAEYALAVLIPTIIAPAVTWYLIGLTVKIHELQTELKKLLTYDALTGVMTRRAFLSRCESLHALLRRNQSPLSFAYLDVDNFKKINDSFGHPGGDQVLVSLASILKNRLRESDLIGRLGGEEFAMVLPDTDLNGAVQLLEEIRLALKNTPLCYSNQDITYTVSIGVATADPNNPISLEQLIKCSDAALYKAKRLGKDCVVGN